VGGGGPPGRAPPRTVNVCHGTVNGCDVIGERLTFTSFGFISFAIFLNINA